MKERTFASLQVVIDAPPIAAGVNGGGKKLLRGCVPFRHRRPIWSAASEKVIQTIVRRKKLIRDEVVSSGYPQIDIANHVLGKNVGDRGSG